MESREPVVYGHGKLISPDSADWQGVSFIVPAHNEQQYLGATLAAIGKAIAELDLLAEVIVVNDQSTDRTAEIAREAGAHVIDVQYRNIGAVRNAGARQAQFPWLIFVDADTLVPPETVAHSLACLADGDSGGGARVVIPDEHKLFVIKRWMYQAVVLGWQVIGGWAAGCYMVTRRELFDDFGGFDENYFAAEEYFFSRELKRRGRFRLVRPPVVTSARKLHQYSTWQLCRFLLVPLTRFRTLFRSKAGLELLYEDRR